ncbi:hypothetical protein STVIR_8155 [Streptomyces viridochromogenes Tue57]|uniref:Uncharacterized protein n=1 Tax=Streptomyces viridochromogenes Tue57 TaxID=1160705 RepID=L8P323_STRVR|nr:hypothetical protein STVIR_8155 [Streptomyces viridochromogenes Tue57]
MGQADEPGGALAGRMAAMPCAVDLVKRNPEDGRLVRPRRNRRR